MQSRGLRLADPDVGAPARRGCAGPTDHKAVTVDGRTVMVPVHTGGASESPFFATAPDADGTSRLQRGAIPIANISFPKTPRFYALQTFDGIPYWKIAQLHGADVLATTVFQTCVRYGNRLTACQFCAIGESLAGGRTINRKTPEQLAEVARAAVLLDGVKHMVMTTGTPNFKDRGAALLTESAFAVRAAVDIPIQAQCASPEACFPAISRPDAVVAARARRCRPARTDTMVPMQPPFPFVPGEYRVRLAAYPHRSRTDVAVFPVARRAA